MRLAQGSASFRVSELPAYSPCGGGEHLYVEVEKEGLTTDVVARLLARVCGAPLRSVGYAGRKDRHAIARQWFSIQLGESASLARLGPPPGGGRIEVLRVGRHRNKLRLGHLRGNRFVLDLVGDGALDALEARLARLMQRGIPNRFGEQRFGAEGSTLATARAWGGGERARGDRRYRRLVSSAAQAAVFNAVLEARHREGLLHLLREGDVAQTPSGASFVCAADDLDDLNGRAAPGRLELFATGPMPGSARFGPAPAVREQERRWSASTGIAWEWLDRGGPLESRGERRPLVVRFLEAPEVEATEAGARLRLALPPGSYATEVLREVGVEVPRDRRSRVEGA
jgi:tRNA pseudouridine13 synthase